MRDMRARGVAARDVRARGRSADRRAAAFERLRFRFATAWRIGALELRDPHVYYSFGLCLDVTDTLNTDLQQQLDADANGDGIYDVERARAHAAAPEWVRDVFGSSDGSCTTAATPQCTPGISPPSGAVRIGHGHATDGLLGGLPGTTSGYTPPVPAPAGQLLRDDVARHDVRAWHVVDSDSGTRSSRHRGRRRPGRRPAA